MCRGSGALPRALPAREGRLSVIVFQMNLKSSLKPTGLASIDVMGHSGDLQRLSLLLAKGRGDPSEGRVTPAPINWLEKPLCFCPPAEHPPHLGTGLLPSTCSAPLISAVSELPPEPPRSASCFTQVPLCPFSHHPPHTHTGLPAGTLHLELCTHHSPACSRDPGTQAPSGRTCLTCLPATSPQTRAGART